MRGLAAATSPLKSLHKGIARRDLSHEQFTRRVLKNKWQNLWDYSQGPKLVPVTRF